MGFPPKGGGPPKKATLNGERGGPPFPPRALSLSSCDGSWPKSLDAKMAPWWERGAWKGLNHRPICGPLAQKGRWLQAQETAIEGKAPTC